MSMPSHSRHLQRGQQQRQESRRSGTGPPTPRSTSWCPTAAAPRCRVRRTRTSCRTSCRSSAGGSRRTSRPRREVPCVRPRSATCRGRRRLSKRYSVVHSSWMPSTGRNSSVPRNPSNLLSANRRRSCHARNSAHVLRLDTVGDDDGDERVALAGTATDDLLGAGPVEVLRAPREPLLAGCAVDPGLHMRDRVEAIDHDPIALHRGRRIDLGAEEAGVLRGFGVHILLPGFERPLAIRAAPSDR